MVYIIIFPKGNKEQIDICQTFDYEIDDYALASRRHYTDEDECIKYAMGLAEKHDLRYVGKRRANCLHDYLD